MISDAFTECNGDESIVILVKAGSTRFDKHPTAFNEHYETWHS